MPYVSNRVSNITLETNLALTSAHRPAGDRAERFGVRAVQEFPTYSPGENTSATTGPTYSQPLPNPWVVSDGTIITPAGTQVYLGTTTRAKAIALNPTGNHTAAVLHMGRRHRAVTVFNTQPAPSCRPSHRIGGNRIQTAAPPASPIRRTASTCCSARTAINGSC